MITDDDVTTVTPNEKIDDAEMRNIRCAIEALEAAHVYMLRIAEARGRGDTADLELAQDQALDLKRGFARAAERRDRQLGAVYKNRRLKAVG